MNSQFRPAGAGTAKQTVITMTDDIDGSEATQTVEFSRRGKSYIIDLSDENASEFDDALAPCTSELPSRPAARGPREAPVQEVLLANARPAMSTRRQFVPGPRPTA